MKYVFNILATIVFGWPALALGYSFAAIRSGWIVGDFLHGEHEDAVIEKFVNKGASHE